MIRSLLKETIPRRTRQLVLDRMEEVSSSPDQAAGVILQKLDDQLNSRNIGRDKNCLELVENLIVELESNLYVDVVRAELLQHKAKHFLFQNEFKTAERYFREALEACGERNRGNIHGQISRDLFGLSVATQPLNPNNHEKYYRHALFAGMFEGNVPSEFSMEDAAVAASNYFWNDLYKPYPGIKATIPPSEEHAMKLVSSFMDLCSREDWVAIDEWAKKNVKFGNTRLQEVRGDTLINRLLKLIYELRKKTAFLTEHHSIPITDKPARIDEVLNRLRFATGRLASQWPKSLNLADFKSQTPLMIAANNADDEMVKALLAAGADPNLQDFKGRTALFAAVAKRSESCTRLIIAAGGDVTLKTKDRFSILHTALKVGHPQIVDLLMSKDDTLTQIINEQGLTPEGLLKEILKDHGSHVRGMAEQGRSTGSIREYQEIQHLLNA